MTTIGPSSSTAPESRGSSKIKPAPRAKRLLRFNSIGTRLFLSVIGGALVGLGGTAYFFYNTLQQQVETELSKTLNSQVASIDGQLRTIEQTGLNVSTAVAFLHNSGVKSPQAYKDLQFSFFKLRLPILKAIGFGQTPYQLVPDRQWFWPYFFVDPGLTGAPPPGQRLPAPYNDILYSDAVEDNYSTKEYYTISATTGKTFWMEPYLNYGSVITTFSTPIYNNQRKLIGVTNIDVNLTTLTGQLKASVLRNAGYFAIVSDKGTLLAYPPNPEKVKNQQSYATIAELKAVWSQLQQGKEGLVYAKGNFWAYQRLPSTNWLMLAAVPESVVLTPVLTITIAGTVGAGVVLAVVVLLFVYRLNRRLKPILDECNKLAQTDVRTEAQLQNLDEIGQLSTSFYNLLKQVAANEQQIRQEVARSVQTQEHLKQAAQEQQENEVLLAEVNHILDVVSAVETGDLTVQAQVSDRTTGLVADTLNRLIEELARIMAAVLSTAQQVNSGAAELEHLAVSAAQQTQQQALSVNEVQALILNFNELSQETAQQAVVSDEAVQQAQSAVTQGQGEMATMTQEISFLQQGTEQIVQRTQLLTNFVASASQFAKDQKQVALLTRVLALNASMIAARASEQEDPEQFASVAREFETVATQVNDLAIQTNQSLLLLQQRTDQIQTVVSGISQDVQEISSSVNSFTQSVDRSSQVLNNIKTVTNRVAQVGQQVTQSSQAIATTASSTLRSIQDIATVASQAEQHSRFTREQAGLMDRLTRTLLERVRFFRLSPGANDSIPTSQVLPSAIARENLSE